MRTIPLYIVDRAIFLASVIEREYHSLGTLAEYAAGAELPDVARQLRACQDQVIHLVNAIQDAVTPAPEGAPVEAPSAD